MNKKSIALILIEISILIIAILGVNSNLINYAPECTFYKITNLQCPSCGGTRCVESILKGQFKEAFLFHPIFFITIFYLLLCNIVYLINLNKKVLVCNNLRHSPCYIRNIAQLTIKMCIVLI